MQTQEKHEDKIYKVYRERVSLNVKDIKTNYVKVHTFKKTENDKTIYIFTVMPIE